MLLMLHRLLMPGNNNGNNHQRYYDHIVTDKAIHKLACVLLIPQRCTAVHAGNELHSVFDCLHFSEFRGLPTSWAVPKCCKLHASVDVVHKAQGPEVCQQLSHCLAAKISASGTWLADKLGKP